MKLKKLFAGVVAVAMMATMAMPSFAAKHTYDETKLEDHSSITVTKVYTMVGTGSSPKETFTLEQVGDGVVTKGGATTAPALGTITGYEFAAGAATASGAKGDITINLPENYTAPGVYEYTLKETVGSNAGVTYRDSNKTIKLVVTVVSDDAGKLYRYAGIHTETSDSDEKSDEFGNTYSANSLALTKKVQGNGADRNKHFDFVIKLTGENGKTYAEKYDITGNAGFDATKSASSIAVGGEAHVWLKNDGTATIANLPKDVQWEITEVGAATATEGNNAGKVVNGEYVVTVPTNANGSISVAENASTNNSVEFINKSTVNVDTGVILDNAPYILMLAVVAGAAMTLVIKKRREEE